MLEKILKYRLLKARNLYTTNECVNLHTKNFCSCHYLDKRTTCHI